MTSKPCRVALVLVCVTLLLVPEDSFAGGRRGCRRRVRRRPSCVQTCQAKAICDCICPTMKLADYEGYTTYAGSLCTQNPPLLRTFDHSNNNLPRPKFCSNITNTTTCEPGCYPASGQGIRRRSSNYIEATLADHGITKKSAGYIPTRFNGVSFFGGAKFVKFDAPTGLVYVKLYALRHPLVGRHFHVGFEVDVATLAGERIDPAAVPLIVPECVTPKGDRSADVSFAGNEFQVVTETLVR